MSTKDHIRKQKKSFLKKNLFDKIVETNGFETSERNYDTNEIVLKHNDKTWKVVILDMTDYGKITIKVRDVVQL